MPARVDDVTRFSNAQAITATAASTNVVDLYDVMHRVGQAPHPISIRVVCIAAFNNLTSLQADFQDSADNSTFANTGMSSGAVVLADLLAGYELMNLRFPQTGVNGTAGQLGMPGAGAQNIRRYVRINYTVVGTAPTAGSVDAFIDVA